MCTCPRRLGKETWLFSRYTTGWKCGVHADWTMLQDCIPDFYEKTYNTTDRVYKYVTIIRNPVDRYFSEYEHLHHSLGTDGICLVLLICVMTDLSVYSSVFN